MGGLEKETEVIPESVANVAVCGDFSVWLIGPFFFGCCSLNAQKPVGLFVLAQNFIIRLLEKLPLRRVIQSVAKNLRPKAEGSILTNQPSGYALRFFATL